ncbi:CPBP family intramembrane glutamic endopeptidase [Gracilimonas amylolytica]|uniref:CPBP family intramembrane glutamic endopeptidase n=1 Tax=Gracilimonas amylolytica TaxID=1749045 RepID=UPI000CD8BB4F|nr:CPBP family intramembrane glutamic endopeptidase [Gracilimonas amylolytica]
MKNPFFNVEEQRLCSLLRIILFLFLFSFGVALPSLIPYTALQFIGISLITLGLYYVMFRFVDQRSWDLAGLSLNSTWMKELFAGIIIAAAVMGVIFLVIWQTNGLDINGFGWERNGQRFWLIPILVFLVQMSSVGFYEELLSRGYLIPNIKEGLTIGQITPFQATLISVFLSSALFGMAHAANPDASITAVINILLAGIMLAIPFVITGRLALSIGLHFSWNFFQGGIFGFRVSGMEIRNSIIQIQQKGPEWWTGGSFGPEAGLTGVLGILLIIILSLVYLRYTGVDLTAESFFTKSYSEYNQTGKTKIT